MSLHQPMPRSDRETGETLADALARSDRDLGRVVPILGHLLSTPDQSLFSEEIVARVRGMISDIAWQMLRAQAEAAGQSGRAAFAERHGEALAEHLQGSAELLSHCHALALEWQLANRMEAQYGLDPVLAPLVQSLVASTNQVTSGAAMAALTAQARFAQAQRRMELPMAELSADLFHETVMAWRAWNGPGSSDVLVRAEAKLRNSYDEGSGRLALFARLIAGIPGEDRRPLAIDFAGVGLWLTALSARTGQSREKAVLATNPRQSARLAVILRAASCNQQEIDDTLLRLHPDRIPPQGAGDLKPSEARDLLGQSPKGGHI